MNTGDKSCQDDMLMRRLLMAWDGQWFLKVTEKFGIEVAIDLNVRVRRSFARIEMREALRDAKIFRNLFSMEEAMAFLWNYLKVGNDGEIVADYEVNDSNSLINVFWCPAFEGAKKAQLERQDQACISCSGMWNAWIAKLFEIDESLIEVKIDKMLSKGDCHCSIRISGVGDCIMPKGSK